jgi:VWFA-related protein
MFLKSSLAFAMSLCLLVAGMGQQPQQPTPAPPTTQDEEDDVVRITSNLVQMDAIVTDGKGRHVTDLKAEDFEIREDGRARPITDFAYVSTTPSNATASALVAERMREGKASSTTTTLGGAPSPRIRALRPEQTRRTIVLAVDDLGMSSENFPHIKRALKKYVDEQMQPGDLVAVVRTSSGAGALQQLTSDKRQLYAVIEQMRWRPRGRAVSLVFNNPEEVGRGLEIGEVAPNVSTAGAAEGVGIGSGQSALDALEATRQEAFTIGTLGALNFLVRGLRQMPGRKSVVLFSDGLSVFTGGGDASRTNPRGMSGQIVDTLRRLTDSASRASVVFYTIHSRGLPTLGVEAADDGLFLGGSNRTGTLRQVLTGNDPRSTERRASFREGQDGLVVLARETGGFAVLGNNDMGQGLGRVIDDQQGFYLLGYRPDEKTFDPETGQRRYRSLTIKVKRKGLSVRSRSGFYGFADKEKPAAPLTRDEQLAAALTSPFSSGDVSLRLTAFFGNEEPEGSFIRSLLHIDTRSLTFTEEPDGWRQAVVDVLAAVFNDDGTIAEQVNQTHTIRVRREMFERSLRSGLVHALNVPVKNAGAYQVRVAVRDKATERVGSVNQFIEVPDIGKDSLALSGIVAAAAPTAANTTNASATSATAASASTAREEAATDTQASPAVRRFSRDMRMDYGYVIYNAKLESGTGKPRLTTQVSLFRDGQRVFNGNPEPFDPGKQTDLKRLVASGRLRLGGDLTPGEYILQVVVTDALAPERARTVMQWLDFEIIR